ncbi:MAG TPA: HlyD family efflux transporter periplasmic adaptor subunit [Lacipirellulaceae bacterium]|nr:HlyD family efflux transporter periplasmic adaptor subunit [Lacipirellulaceae bacterium]
MSNSGFSSDPAPSSTSRASGGAAVDEEAVLRAKQEIQSLVQEVVDLSKSEIEPTDFYAALLEKSISALAAIGGVVWTYDPSTGFKLEYQVNLQQTGLRGSPEAMNQHSRLLGQLAKRGEGALVAPHSGATVGDDDQSAANPTEFLLVVAPVTTDRGVDGLIEIFQRTGARPNTQRGYLRFLQQICEIAGEYLKTRRLRDFGAKQTLWEQLESFTSLVHERLDSRSTAFTIANEGRRLVGCDRVTVVLKRGPKYVVEAISGQDTFDKRSNVVRMLRDLSAVVIRSGEDLWYTGDTTNLSPQVEKAVNDYVDESHTKQIAVLPLREADPLSDDPTRPRRAENMLGAIVIEQLVDSRPPDGLLQRVEVVRKHSSTALTNAQSHEGLFLLPLWRFIGKSRVLVAARNLPKTILATLAIVAAALAMWLVKWDFTVAADGKLLPATRRYVFAPAEGTITEVPVRDGQTVAAGQVVARQESLTIENEIIRLTGAIESNYDQIAGIDIRIRQMDRTQVRDTDYGELLSERSRLRTESKALERQLAIQRRKHAQLEIVSPIDGKVVTWKVHDNLENRPVRTGMRLMEIADPTKDWELEIEVPEAKMGHVVRQLEESRRADPEAPLLVTFILATHPSARLEGRVTHIDSSAEMSGEQGNTVHMDVQFHQAELIKLLGSPEAKGPDAAPRPPAVADAELIAELKRNLKVGADVKAKIHCGRASIGYVWFHELWEFIQSRILFRF